MTPSGFIPQSDLGLLAARSTGARTGNPDNPAPAAFSEPLGAALANAKTVEVGDSAVESGLRSIAEPLPADVGALPESGKTLPAHPKPGELNPSGVSAASDSPPKPRVRLRSQAHDSDVRVTYQGSLIPFAPMVVARTPPKDPSAGGTRVSELPTAAPPSVLEPLPSAGYPVGPDGDPFAVGTERTAMLASDHRLAARNTLATPSEIFATHQGSNTEPAIEIPFASTESAVTRSEPAATVLDAPQQPALESASSLLDSRFRRALEQPERAQLQTLGTGSSETIVAARDLPSKAAWDVTDFTSAVARDRQSGPSAATRVVSMTDVSAEAVSERPVAPRVSAGEWRDHMAGHPVDALTSAAGTPAPEKVGTTRMRSGMSRQQGLESFASVAATLSDPTVGTAARLERVGQPEPQAAVGPPGDVAATSSEDFFAAEKLEDTITRHVAWMTRTGVNEAELRLDPQELGSLQIRVTVREDQASVSFAATESSVREVLQEQVGRLRELLGEQGLSLAESNVRAGHDAEHSDSSPERSEGGEPEQADTEDTAEPGSAERSSRLTGAIDAYA